MYDEDYQLSLFGDFNLPTIGWSSNTIHPGGSSYSTESLHLLLNFMSENLCTQFILQPTRADNILDLYISNSEDLVSHVSVSDTVFSDHRLVEILLSYNPCSFVSSSHPDFFNSSFHSLDFHKADFNSINEKLSSVDWDLLIHQCEFPELFTPTLLQICLICCPIKVIPKNKASAPVQISSRRKRKIQTQLEEATNLSHCPQSRIDSLKRKLALAHIDISDAINNDLLLREQQAVEKVNTNPKYFYSYAKKFSKKKSSIIMLFYKIESKRYRQSSSKPILLSV